MVERRNGSRGKARLKVNVETFGTYGWYGQRAGLNIRPSTKVLTCVNRRVSGGATESCFDVMLPSCGLAWEMSPLTADYAL